MQAKADHLRQEHRHRLAEHRGLRLNAANAPAEHAEAVDHRRVGVGADEGVGIGERRRPVAVPDEDHAGKVFEVDLVDDAGVGRDHGEALERLLAPAQEGVPLGVALELALSVAGERIRRAEHVDLHRMIDDELDGGERVDPRRIAAQLRDRIAHRRQVDDDGYAGEVLEQDPRRGERDLRGWLGPGVPARDGLDVGGGDRAVALRAQEVLEQHLERERQSRDVEARLQRVETEDLEPPCPHRELCTGVEAVCGHDGSWCRRGIGSQRIIPHARSLSRVAAETRSWARDPASARRGRRGRPITSLMCG